MSRLAPHEQQDYLHEQAIEDFATSLEQAHSHLHLEGCCADPNHHHAEAQHVEHLETHGLHAGHHEDDGCASHEPEGVTDKVERGSCESGGCSHKEHGRANADIDPGTSHNHTHLEGVHKQPKAKLQHYHEGHSASSGCCKMSIHDAKEHVEHDHDVGHHLIKHKPEQSLKIDWPQPTSPPNEQAGTMQQHQQAQERAARNDLEQSVPFKNVSNKLNQRPTRRTQELENSQSIPSRPVSTPIKSTVSTPKSKQYFSKGTSLSLSNRSPKITESVDTATELPSAAQKDAILVVHPALNPSFREVPLTIPLGEPGSKPSEAVEQPMPVLSSIEGPEFTGEQTVATVTNIVNNRPPDTALTFASMPEATWAIIPEDNSILDSAEVSAGYAIAEEESNLKPTELAQLLVQEAENIPTELSESNELTMESEQTTAAADTRAESLSLITPDIVAILTKLKSVPPHQLTIAQVQLQELGYHLPPAERLQLLDLLQQTDKAAIATMLERLFEQSRAGMFRENTAFTVSRTLFTASANLTAIGQLVLGLVREATTHSAKQATA